MHTEEFMRTIIKPTLTMLRQDFQIGSEERAGPMLLVIAQQESELKYRDQLDESGQPRQIGPATGFWQFEKNGGTAGVLQHPASRAIAQKMCERFNVSWQNPYGPWEFFALGGAEGDTLACVFARLLLLTDPAPLPSATRENGEVAFQYYLRNWRPGAWTNGGVERRAGLRSKFLGNWDSAVGVPPVTGKDEALAEILIDIDTLRDKVARLLGG